MISAMRKQFVAGSIKTKVHKTENEEEIKYQPIDAALEAVISD